MKMTEHVVSADGARIAYDISGAGETFLVYVHGAGGDRTSQPEMKRLLGQRFRVISYDRRGRGDSSEGGPYSFEREAEDLRAILSVCSGVPVVFGVSLGARIALELLRDAPVLSRMVLFEPPATDKTDPLYARNLAEIGAYVARGDAEGAVIRNMELLHGKSKAEIDALKTRAVEWATRVANAAVSYREMTVVHVTDLFVPSAYEAPRFPVHLLVGTETLPFIQQSAELISSLAFLERHDLAGLNHSAPTTEAGRLMHAIEACLGVHHL